MVDEDDPGRLCPRHRGRHDPREAQLTPAVYRHGLGVPLPETVHAEWRARPGTDPRLGSAMAEQLIRIPIVGREEWDRAARRSA